MKDTALGARCQALQLILTDVDGVLTDGRLLLLPDGQEAKAFHVRDGLAVVMAQLAGLRVGLLSGRSSAAVARRAEELRLTVARQGVRDKPAALREILAELGLEAHQVAYVGDDLNDVAVLGQVGLSAAPADAPFDVRAQVFMTLQTPGGQGCFREFVDAILRARGDWDRVAAEVAGADMSI